MNRGAPAFSLAALLVFLARAFGESASDPQDILALEAAVQKAIRKAEPAIACVLVSRSDGYRQLKAGPVSGAPGQLGGFDQALLLEQRLNRDSPLFKSIKKLDLSDPDNVPESFGSGIVMDPSGLILTNYHVVRDAAKVFVRLPGGAGSYANIHAADPRSDLAVLRLIERLPNLHAIQLGDGDLARKGQFVISLANPFAAGFRDGSPSASWGIISNIRRRPPGSPSEVDRARTSIHHYGTLLQTDARLNAGCSGGALLNLRGELIGITSALAALTGIDTPGGFAVPMTQGVRRIINKLKSGEEVEYGFLGVGLDKLIGPTMGDGVRIARIIPGSPAEEAGLRPYEYVTKIGDITIHENEELFLAISTYLAGTKIAVERAQRPGGPRRTTAPIELVKSYSPASAIVSHRPPARGGIRVDYTSTLLRGELTERPYLVAHGVVIREIVPGSAAEAARVQVGEIITEVDGRPVNKPSDYYREMADAKSPVELTLQRLGGGQEKIKIEIR